MLASSLFSPGLRDRMEQPSEHQVFSGLNPARVLGHPQSIEIH